ncbi:hypothetical protein KAJ89_04015 [Candidatus Parcubacteria bacterium]|nr:hypothetical protein [Candidatus Parcubacteria bacterium]
MEPYLLIPKSSNPSGGRPRKPLSLMGVTSEMGISQTGYFVGYDQEGRAVAISRGVFLKIKNSGVKKYTIREIIEEEKQPINLAALASKFLIPKKLKEEIINETD